jgi:hypothetical protein
VRRSRRIRSEWASLVPARDGSIVVCVQSDGKGRCIRFDSGEWLGEAVRSKRIRAKKWIVALPRTSCILRAAAVPAADLGEAAKMIEFELPSLVPLVPEQVVYGCTLLEAQQDMLNVLVHIVKLKKVDEYLETYAACGIEPQIIILDALAIASWFKTASDSVERARICVLADKDRAVVITLIDGNFRSASELPISSEDVVESLREVASEILEHQEQLTPGLREEAAILLAGPAEYIREIKERLDRLAEIVPPGEVTIIANSEIGSRENSEDGDNAVKFSLEQIVAAGLPALAGYADLTYCNLLPRRYIVRHRQKMLIFNCLVTAGLLVVLIVVVWAWFWASNRKIERRCRAIESQIAPIADIAAAVDRKRQKLRSIRRQLSNRGRITKIIEELYRFTPRAISISELKIVSTYDSGSVRLKGQADLLATAFEYTEAMQEAELLDRIQIVNAQQIPRPGGSVVEFKADCDVQEYGFDDHKRE